ncbi:hypothetical protein SARC_12287 [Sphaeroforma arctica JP610]|uniref:Uncharacterized protein n=1 Tax=Sphaeroforma arctica JP610 TaxID=667725 RepID=A0A0L0FFE7_9EUKA|nr:hypothetical protein SARC_12287 [Sphaeroforma arctica JP610]KNC75181.1 hypothetical protein SARC_12287 [Sphaeroforma arctica JP610]|eukprot:XP_014149083.1 hypothetical protein SARC_12287 [Sphaeroforma arctica JP610]
MNGTTEDEETSPSSTPTLNSSTLQKHEYAEVPTIKVAMIIQTEGPLSPDAGANMDVTTQDGGPQSCGSVASIELAAQPGVTGIENTTGEEAVSDDCRDNGSLPSNTPLPANKMLKPQLKPVCAR